MDKQNHHKTNEEFGMEFGDINAAKFYETLNAAKTEKKKKQQRNEKPDCP